MPLYPLSYQLFTKDKGDRVSPLPNFPMKRFWKYSIAIDWLTRFVLESQTSMVYTEVCRRWRYIVPWISTGHLPGEVLLEIFDRCRLGACGTTLSWNHKLRRYTLLHHVTEDGDMSCSNQHSVEMYFSHFSSPTVCFLQPSIPDNYPLILPDNFETPVSVPSTLKIYNPLVPSLLKRRHRLSQACLGLRIYRPALSPP